MVSIGEFYKVEKDGKLFLLYHHPKYQPISQTQSSTSSGEATNDDKLLFLCPHARRLNHVISSDQNTFLLDSSPEYVFSTTSTDKEDKPSLGVRFDDHPVHPLLSYKKIDAIGGCPFCHGSNFDPCYYLCEIHRYTYHKECVESPLQIQHPYHPQHSLQLSFHYYKDHLNIECLCCGKSAINLVYQCTICQIFIHSICAMKPIPFVIDPPKRHDHFLTFFPRQTSLTCNVCGLLRTLYPTYICATCNFVSHIDCMNSPHIIKISRHQHRISYNASLPSAEWSCGVCRKNIDGDYGAYTCDKCGNYAVHSRCALRKDVWDGVELDVSDDIIEDAGPFEMISEGVILHFLHYHPLRLEVSILYDESKICQACVLPIFEGNFYSCAECSFILHETCAKACRRVQHALHPHPLTLTITSRVDVSGWFTCKSCGLDGAGFVYHCPIAECGFILDVRCASISEPFTYLGHEHPLFLALDPEEKPICHVCNIKCRKQLNCIKCDFIICFGCASLPYKAKYKHDEHFLKLLWGEEVSGKDWCEICERNIGDTDTKALYWCTECCTTLHITCLFGEDLYLKPGQLYKNTRKEIQILGKRNISRPFCNNCKSRCQGLIFKRDNRVACSLNCSSKLFY